VLQVEAAGGILRQILKGDNMVMFRGAAFGLLMVLCAASAFAQPLSPGAFMAAETIQKAVPKVDKSLAEVVGTVRQAIPLTECGATGTLIVLGVKGLLPGGEVPVAGFCGGTLNTPCRRLRIGSRIRLQGVMAPVPDPETEGFDPCDPSTWETFTPLQTFAVTKILK
jgi:hypothetical protein